MAEQNFIWLVNEAYWLENGQWLTVILYSDMQTGNLIIPHAHHQGFLVQHWLTHQCTQQPLAVDTHGKDHKTNMHRAYPRARHSCCHGNGYDKCRTK